MFTLLTSRQYLQQGDAPPDYAHRLKFDAADENQGIFFVAADGTATRVSVVGRNMPADLMFMVPDGLAAGEYTLEVRAVFASNDVRTGALAVALTVS